MAGGRSRELLCSGINSDNGFSFRVDGITVGTGLDFRDSGTFRRRLKFLPPTTWRHTSASYGNAADDPGATVVGFWLGAIGVVAIWLRVSAAGGTV